MQITRWHTLPKVFKMLRYLNLCHLPVGFHRFQWSKETRKALIFQNFKDCFLSAAISTKTSCISLPAKIRFRKMCF